MAVKFEGSGADAFVYQVSTDDEQGGIEGTELETGWGSW